MAGPKRSRRNCIRGAFRILGSRGVKKRQSRAFFCTKFLDVYCGCSEDGSLPADNHVAFTNNKHQKGIKPPLKHSIPEAVDMGGVFHLQDPQLGFTSQNSVLTVTELHGDTYMESENYIQTPVEIIAKETAAFPSKSVESQELPQKSKTTAESEWPWMHECPSPMDIKPSRSVGFLEHSTASLLSGRDSGICEQSENISSSRMHW